MGLADSRRSKDITSRASSNEKKIEDPDNQHNFFSPIWIQPAIISSMFTYSIPSTLCESDEKGSATTTLTPPPKMQQPETFDEKFFRKFRKQPLIPIGCAATAYFLVSGLKSFRNQDPVRSQRMMKYRVAAQFVTLICFVGYVGIDSKLFDFRLAPMYQDVQKAKRLQQQEQQANDAEKE